MIATFAAQHKQNKASNHPAPGEPSHTGPREFARRFHRFRVHFIFRYSLDYVFGYLDICRLYLHIYSVCLYVWTYGHSILSPCCFCNEAYLTPYVCSSSSKFVSNCCCCR